MRPTPCSHRRTELARGRRAPRAWRRRGWRLVTVALIGTALAAGCTAGGSDDAATDADVAAPTSANVAGSSEPAVDDLDVAGVADDPGEDAGEAGGDGEEAGPGVPGTGDDVRGEHVVRTAEITLEMEDTERALSEVRAVAERVGGTVATADLRRDRPAGDLGGTIVVRVPSPHLLPTLDGLEELAADAPVRRIDERDVTSEVVDLRARVTNLTAYEEELRALLTEVREGTSDADRLLPVFERAQEVRSDIDRLSAQRDALADRVARSTITVTVRPAPGAEPVPATSWTPLRTVERALATTVGALATVTDVAIWLLVVALPIALVVLGPPALGVRAWRRSRPAAGSAGRGGSGSGSRPGSGSGTPSTAAEGS